MNIRLRKTGGKILFDPALKSICYTRSTPGKLYRQYFDYGLYRALTAKKHPGTLMPRQMLLPIAIFLIIACTLLSVISCWFTIVPLFYVAVIFINSLILAFKKDVKYLPFLLIIYPIVHFSWVFGFFFGKIKWQKNNKK